ncbi:hypothetical protein AB0G20_24600 [Streptomyces sp. NPDC024017]|uniref:hypothetical protein n=1 Tax=Streptomyces sp. NPDC024017 TaxID=3154326 RepID=UPI0033D4E18E
MTEAGGQVGPMEMPSTPVVAFAPAGDYTDESWSTTATIEEFHAEFAGWDPRVTDARTGRPRPSAV